MGEEMGELIGVAPTPEQMNSRPEWPSRVVVIIPRKESGERVLDWGCVFGRGTLLESRNRVWRINKQPQLLSLDLLLVLPTGQIQLEIRARCFINQAMLVSPQGSRPRWGIVNLEGQRKGIKLISQRVLNFSLVQALFSIYWLVPSSMSTLDKNHSRSRVHFWRKRRENSLEGWSTGSGWIGKNITGGYRRVG